MTGGDRRAVEKCFVKAGVRAISELESPLSLLAYTGSIGGLFLDIGGGKTEVAAVTNAASPAVSRSISRATHSTPPSSTPSI